MLDMEDHTVVDATIGLHDAIRAAKLPVALTYRLTYAVPKPTFSCKSAAARVFAWSRAPLPPRTPSPLPGEQTSKPIHGVSST